MSNNPYLAHRQRKQYNPQKQQQLHGNYPFYYGYRHTTRLDPRLLILKPEWFQNKRMLDIGCHSGILTLEIAFLLQPKSVLGVDIDPQLIQQARSHLRVWRTQQYQETMDYFPLSCVPYDRSTANVNFRLCDYANEPFPLAPEYDVILLLSITKWIHLNGGDGAIKYVLKKVYHSLSKGGILVLEPQPFEGYKKRVQSEEMQHYYDRIKFYPDDFEGFLVALGMTVLEKQTSLDFKRPVIVLKKD
ncbi:Bicoid-interacting protein 3-domain-containing protein [Gorgonomyces haynaldii]|nr:Bicoid-interacting protein 3-domain-containing protein [Gorgonomyces haynaldii]